MSSYLYMFRTHKVTGKKITEVEGVRELHNFELTPKNKAFAFEVLSRKGVGYIEKRVARFKDRRAAMHTIVQRERAAGGARALDADLFVKRFEAHRTASPEPRKTSIGVPPKGGKTIVTPPTLIQKAKGGQPVTMRVLGDLQGSAALAQRLIESGISDSQARQRKTPAGQIQLSLDKAAKTVSKWINPIVTAAAQATPVSKALSTISKGRGEKLVSDLAGEIVVGIPRIVPAIIQLGDPDATVQFKVSGAFDIVFGGLDVVGMGASNSLLVKGLRRAFSKPSEVSAVLKAAGVEGADKISKSLASAVKSSSDEQLQAAINAKRASTPTSEQVAKLGSQRAAQASTPTKTAKTPQKAVSEAPDAIDAIRADKTRLRSASESNKARMAALESEKAAELAKGEIRVTSGLDPRDLEILARKAYQIALDTGIKIEDAIRQVLRSEGLADDAFDSVSDEAVRIMGEAPVAKPGAGALPKTVTAAEKEAVVVESAASQAAKQGGEVPLVGPGSKATVDPLIKAFEAAAGGRGFVATVKGLFQNSFDVIKKSGANGGDISRMTAQARLRAKKIVATLGGRLHRDIKKQFGLRGLHSAEGRAFADTVVAKMRRGESLGPKGDALIKSYGKLMDILDELAFKVGISPIRTVGKVDKAIFGKKVRFQKEVGQELVWDEGVAIGESVDFVNGGGLIVKTKSGDTIILRPGTKFMSQSLIRGENFFPKKFREGALETLRKGSSDFNTEGYERAVKHLVDTKQAKTVEQAEIMVDNLAKVGTETVEDIAPLITKGINRKEGQLILNNVRVGMRRDGMTLPSEFYQDNFIAVVDQHISETARAIAMAEHFGNDFGKLGDLLVGASPRQVTDVTESIKTIFNMRPRQTGVDKFLGATARIEGVFTTLTKLGLNYGTAALQFGADINSFSKFGGAIKLKALGRIVNDEWTRAFKDPEFITLRQKIADSGAVQSNVIDIFADDLSGASRKLVNDVMVVSGIKPVDDILRRWAAASGDIYVETLTKQLKTLDPASKKYARVTADLKGWFNYTDADIERMVEQGVKGADLDLAFEGGARTQILVDSGEIPQTLARWPGGRILFRLQSFNYGQARVLGDALVQAKRGNFLPIIRMNLGYAIAGEGVLDLKAYVNDLFDDGERFEKRMDGLNEMYDAWVAGDKLGAFEKMGSRAFANQLGAGMYGLYGIVAEDSVNRFGGGGIDIPGFDSIGKLGRDAWNGTMAMIALARETDSDKSFLAELGKQINIGGAENVVIWRRIYKKFHEGQTPKAFHADDGGSSFKLDIPSILKGTDIDTGGN